MKKKLVSVLFALVLVCSFSLVTAVPAMAWDVEDPCVAANEDFVSGGGFDADTAIWEFHLGEQDFLPGGPVKQGPPDGYNLYRDDVTDTGTLDSVFISTTTPDKIDLLGQAPYPGEEGYWIMSDASPDTYYWALEPRGRDFTKAEILKDSGVPGKGLDKAPGLQKPFNPNSKAGEHAGKK